MAGKCFVHIDSVLNLNLIFVIKFYGIFKFSKDFTNKVRLI